MKSRKPTNAALDRIFAGATAARVIEVKWVPIFKGTKPLRAEDSPLLRVHEAQDLADLRAGLTVGRSGFHCMCEGGPVLEISGPEGPRARISLHHGQSIRWDSEWESDAELVDGMRLVRWLAARGVQGPLEGVLKATEQARKAAEDMAHWKQAMPECLAPLASELLGEGGSDWVVFRGSGVQTSPSAEEKSLQSRAMRALNSRYADPREVIRILLGWFGEGAGPWSRYSAYESGAEALLASFDVASLTAVVSGGAQTPTQVRGAARALWSRAKEAREHLSPELRDRLRSAILDSPDNLDLFDVAFLGKPRKLSEDERRKFARRAVVSEVRDALAGEVQKVESRGFGAFGEQGPRRVAVWAEEDGSLRVIYYNRGENAGDRPASTAADAAEAARNWLLRGTKLT